MKSSAISSRGLASGINHLWLTLNALKELAPSALFAYFRYRFRLVFGKTFLSPSIESQHHFPYALNDSLFPPPDIKSLQAVLSREAVDQLIQTAEEICCGKYLVFDHYPMAILSVNGTENHWSIYAARGLGSLAQAYPHKDIKFIWEAGRLGFIFPLARVFLLTQDERYSKAFWDLILSFIHHNPPYQGVHWLSAQEVALRLMAMVFGYTVFASSSHSTSENRQTLAWAVMAHAKRIPLTLSYAYAQNNNHLISEAVGLYTAGLALPDYPSAHQWQEKGWQIAHHAFQKQISSSGCYIQHSTNYHRMMLQLALWLTLLWQNQAHHPSFPTATAERLQAATRWLLALVDHESGAVPNLGHNDGSYIFPLSSCEYQDYRPVIQAAAQIFLSTPLFTKGIWDEMPLWFSAQRDSRKTILPAAQKYPPQANREPHRITMPNFSSWAYLRVAHFTSRPAHADQLHVDLWWNGLNIAIDGGTYLYNADPPWDNIFTSTFVHNTVSVNNQEQMRRAGRFLYLQWAQAKILSHSFYQESETLTAQHEGYRKLGILHQRTLTAHHHGIWEITDVLHPVSAVNTIDARLHWLLLDAEYQLDQRDNSIQLRLFYPNGTIKLDCFLTSDQPILGFHYQLSRAGRLLCGSGEVPPWSGWTSPQYGTKHPALSLAIETRAKPPIIFKSTFNLNNI